MDKHLSQAEGPRNSNVTIRTVSSFEDAMESLGSMADTDPSATFFSTPVWLNAWWHSFGAGLKPMFVFAYDNEVPIACAPLVFECLPLRLKGRLVQFAGSGISDYSDFISPLVGADRTRAMRILLKWLLCNLPDTVFDLRQIPEHSLTLEVLKELIPREGVSGALLADDVCPVVDLSTEVGSHLSGSLLKEIRRNEHLLGCQGNLVFLDRISADDGDWTLAVDKMMELHGKRLRAKGHGLVSPATRAFVESVIRTADTRGRLRLSGAYLDSALIAYELSFVHNRSVYLWNRAFDERFFKYGVGKITLLRLAKCASKEGFTLLDLLRGKESYKDRWATRYIHNYRAVFTMSPNLGAAVVFKWLSSWEPRARQSSLIRRLASFLRKCRS